MQGLVVLIGGWLISKAIGRIMLTLGLGFVTIVNMKPAIQWLEQLAKDQVNTLPSDVISYMGVMKADVALSIFFSAVAVKVSIMVLKRLTGVT